MPRTDYHTKEPAARRQEHLARRLVHLISPVFLVYYWLDPLLLGLPKRFWVILIVVVVLLFEFARARFGWHIPGMREHERSRISSAAIGGVGLAIGLLLFPPHLVAGCFAAMAWVDPLAGELRERKTKGSLLIVGVAYAVVFIAVQLLLFPGMFGGLVAIHAVILGGLAGVVGAYIEEESPEWLDDDLTMHLVPVLVLFPLSLYSGFSQLGLP